jgi:hypothetical protein
MMFKKIGHKWYLAVLKIKLLSCFAWKHPVVLFEKALVVVVQNLVHY